MPLGRRPMDSGTTSACAENTGFTYWCVVFHWNYLRVRGEYTPPAKWCGWNRELPPRARRIPSVTSTDVLGRGTTSACAENTQLCSKLFEFHWNYLRVRGEYHYGDPLFLPDVELPPRARRILPHTVHGVLHSGTTSACAENTRGQRNIRLTTGNYLRVRGEYSTSTTGWKPWGELPPRARRILATLPPTPNQLGTTSACAENTLAWGELTQAAGNYLRVRGEYRVWLRINDARAELPPRARRILIIAHALLLFLGTTSACAENTIHCIRFGYRGWNYLRVRGEYPSTISRTFWMTELPPRARRIRLADAFQGVDAGTTSACAENTLNELGLL